MPEIITGAQFADHRGVLLYNNDFDLQSIKRMYVIKNQDISFVRAWQGHKIEKRWFCAIQGAFEIQIIKIDHWDNPTKSLPKEVFSLSEATLDVLYVPNGYVTAIQATQKDATLLVYSDYALGEIQDEYRWNKNYFIV